ncbi:hypothetical protein ACQKF2_24030 [Pseudomonas hunanensis]|uniref:hypothetical protein n=1 Tax=Pseudomonas hunanensis TaxID=1247546 RepID=UPI003CFDD420
MIKTCAEIRRQLWYPENLAVAQGYENHPRHEAPLRRLAEKVGILSESFVRSTDSKHITVQQYLMPVPLIFDDICRYSDQDIAERAR